MSEHSLFKTSDGAALRFWVAPEQNNAASERNGRPIFDEVLYVEVITPGSRESAPVFICERKYAEETGITEPYRGPKYTEYSAQIEAFRNDTGSSDLRGTPLRVWPAMSASLVATCEHGGIFTVEALAALPETAFKSVGPGAREWRDRAAAYLETAAGNAPTERLLADNAELRRQVESLSAQVAALGGGTAPAPIPAPEPDPLAPPPIPAPEAEEAPAEEAPVAEAPAPAVAPLAPII